MIAHWLVKNLSPQLIIFCNGWGMDHHPLVLPDSGGCDLLVLSDYSSFEIPVDIDALVSDYQLIHLVCWSFGVWAGQQLFANRNELFASRLAINGTLRPIDDRYGIPLEFFNATLEHFSASVRDRFYRRMCRPDDVLRYFLEHCPRRGLASMKSELERLAQLVDSQRTTDPIFDTAIVSSRDKIVPTAHQLSFWQERCPVVRIEGCHYPFSAWRSWSEIIALRQ